MGLRVLGAVAILATAYAAVAQSDPAADLRSKDVKKRLAAVESLRSAGHAEAETLLLSALKDRDWEVVHRAAEALGTRGGAASLKPLVQLALQGPVRRIRLAAAASLAKLDAATAADALHKKLRGRTLFTAADALRIVPHPVAIKNLEKLLRAKDGRRRIAALEALGALEDPARVPFFTPYLRDRDIRVRAAAVRALVRTGAPGAVSPLRDGLKAQRMPAVMERRHIAGIRTILAGIEDEKRRGLSARLCAQSLGGAGPLGDARFARLLGTLGAKEAPVGPVDVYRSLLVERGITHAKEEVRSASIAALARTGAVDAYERIERLCKTDRSPRVRFHALRAAVTLKGDESLPLLVDRLQKDEDLDVQEEAAVICGRRRLQGAFDALSTATKSPSWSVATCAAISLGKLRDARAFGRLKEMFKHKDWRYRASAIAGLGWLRLKGALPVLIDALRDKDSAVKATALEFLRHSSGKPMGPKIAKWRQWWSTHGPTFVFRDPKKEAQEAKKYGYAVTPAKVYEDLDVIVLVTRKGGDNIQFLLSDYEVDHRTIRAASLSKVGLHPHAVFVSNCPGEIVDDDARRIRWFVRAGGYLFASCWALTHTVERAFPGVVRKLPTRAQVVDTVIATPCPVHSRFLDGVFDGVTEPLYELVGSHLIEVIDTERFEVLIDSPATAARWGDGNLAGWFSVGHGIVLDSANHFDMQGMKQVRLKNEKERMAFAVDHLGYDYKKLRELRSAGVFAKQPAAIRGTRDLSTFRFITTFVRQKRLGDAE